MEKLVKQVIKRAPNPNIINWPKNWVLKLISLFFAIFLWYFVVGEDKVDTNVFIPVEIVNLPRDLVISNQFKKQLEVTVSGPRGLINGINRQHISRTINLSKAEPGTVVIRNESDSISFPRGISVLRVQPSHITLLLDRLIEKTLSIEAKTAGSPAEGHELAKIVLNPPSITIGGPQAVVGQKHALITKPIDLSGMSESFSTQVPLDLKPEILELIGETVVNAEVHIREKTTELSLNDIEVQVLSAVARQKVKKISDKTVKMRLSLPLSMAHDKKKLKELIQARIWADALPPGIHKIQVEVTAPEAIRLIEIIPANITVEIAAEAKK